MGIIRKQSILSSIIIYTGFLVGAINTWFFTTGNHFTEAEYGLTRVMFDISQTFFALANLGAITILYRFYPYYRDLLPLKQRDLFGKMLVIALIGFAVVCLFSLLFKDLVVQKFGTNSPLLVEYFYTIYPFTLGLLLFSMMEGEAWNMSSSVAANFFKELVLRLLTTFIILLFVLHWLNFKGFIHLFSLLYCVIFLGLLFYLYRKGQIFITLKTSVVTRRMYKKMIPYGIFVFLVSFCTILARNFDSFIISSVLGLKYTGIFNFSSYLTSVMEGPQRGLVAASIPVIAQAWKDRDLDRIKRIYRQSSINMLLFSSFLFGLIWLNFHNAFEILNINPSYLQGQTVLLLLGITKIVELGTGVNTQIILTSRYWRMDFITTVTLLFTLIPLNYLLIKKYGINGSAAATLIAYVFFNLIRFLFIWVKFKMQPFTWRTLLAVAAIAACYFASHYLIKASSPILEAVLQSTVYVILCVVMILSLRISEDANRLYEMGWEKVRGILGK
jgi:O-antigen/teichoic acid export membrane protein